MSAGGSHQFWYCIGMALVITLTTALMATDDEIRSVELLLDTVCHYILHIQSRSRTLIKNDQSKINKIMMCIDCDDKQHIKRQ